MGWFMKFFQKVPYWYLLALPIICFGVGFALNALVMKANNGVMPVMVPGGCPSDFPNDGIHACATSLTHLKFLSDWIYVRSTDSIMSIGDFLEKVWYDLHTICSCAWVALMIAKVNELRKDA